MNTNIKLALLGGDARQSYLAAHLADIGFECAVWGLGEAADIGKAVRCRAWQCAVRSASAVILPLPVSVDAVSINCDYGNGVEVLKFTALLDACEAPIFGGRIGESFLSAARIRNKRVIDYFDSECLQIRNARPTAEGAIAIAMQRLTKTICGCRAAVVGYGRIGKMLACLLGRMGAEVTVAARSYGQLAEASSFGNSTVRLSCEKPLGGLGELFENGTPEVIFNTVPARLFDKTVLEHIPAKALLIDLASVPGGVDFAFAEERGIDAVWALSLPGKYAPESAGEIIAATLLEYFEREGIT